MTEFILAIIEYVAIAATIVVGIIAVAIAIGAVIEAVSEYLANSPEILGDLADAALVHCKIDRALSDVLDKVGPRAETYTVRHGAW